MAQIVRLHNNIEDNLRNHGTTVNPNNQDNHHITSTGTGTTGSTSSSTVRARACARTRACAREGHDPETCIGNIDAEQAARFAAYQAAVEYYEQSFGLKAGLSLHRDVRDAVLQGCSADVIIACIQEAEAAPRPSWGYARAVLRRCLASGIKTAEDWERDRQRRTAARQPAGAGAQRTYTPEDFARVFTDLGLDDDDD